MRGRRLFRIIISHMAVFVVLSLLSQTPYAQGGDAKLKPEAKPTPVPKGAKATKTVAGSVPPSSPATRVLTFDQEAQGRLDPRNSEKSAGNLVEEHTLNAKSDDLLSFQLQGKGTELRLQLFDKDDKEVALTKDGASGEFKINSPTGGLPGDGEYRVRVLGAVTGKAVIPYSLKVVRIGLTGNVYNDRFNQIIINFRENEPASVETTLAKLEELVKDDSSRSGAFEMLGIIYLYNKKDFEKAEAAMQQAINLNGAAVVKISYDGQWRRMAKLKAGNFGWEDARTGWLRIRPGQLMLTDPSNRSLASLNGTQIKELSKILTANNNLVTITADIARRPFIFAPGTGEQAEADLVIKLIQNYVMGKSN